MYKNILYRNIGILQEAVAYGNILQQTGSMVELDSLLQDLLQLTVTTEKLLQQENGALISLGSRCCKNLCASINEFHARTELRQRIFSMEIVSLVWNLDRIVHRQFDVLDCPKHWLIYRKEILKRSHDAHALVGKKHYKYKVSIILTAYNKLDYTKKAVESIYRYTDFSSGNIELITVNNGSSDGTREYFESLPNIKKINYHENVLGVDNCPAIYEGEYLVGFSNDIVATPHWLDNLLACIESDEYIADVVPVCGDYSISCMQGIHVAYENTFAGLPAMEQFATKYNHSNPRLWEERAVLMPFLACCRREVLEAGVLDCIYTQADFIDDDLSTTLRRTGWKQILIRDTYMHHFGGVTLNDYRRSVKNNSLQNMRQVYYEKWGIDAWDSRAMHPSASEFFSQVSVPDQADVLWIEPLFCGSALTMKQIIQESGKAIGNSIALVKDNRYHLDAKAFFKKVIAVNDYEYWLTMCTQKYDIISTGRLFNDLIKYEPLRLIQLMYAKLKPNGWLLLPIQNCQGVNAITTLLFEDVEFKFGEEDTIYKMFNVQRLLQNLMTVRYPGQCIVKTGSYYGDDTKTKQFLAGLMSSGIQADWAEIYKVLSVSYIWIGIQKR